MNHHRNKATPPSRPPSNSTGRIAPHRPPAVPFSRHLQHRLQPHHNHIPRASQPSSISPRQPSTGHVSSLIAPAWPWNPHETNLIRAGYKPAFAPAPQNTTAAPAGSTATTPGKCTSTATSAAAPKKPAKMAEPRARMARHKGQMNFSSELRLLLLAYGDPSPHPSFPSEPLPETVRVLDEIVTDFVLEMCHGAAQYASYSRRQKIKVDDFRFALRRDPNKLGRVQELLRMERELKEARKAFDQNDDQVANLKDAKKGMEDVGEGGGGADGKKSKGKGKRGARRDSDVTDDMAPKKRKTG
ncbi:TFIID-18kDa-domain-containing protein [Aspergillus campestris IBT 28561]|uniref:Transcription initiation factor TFIID subunit 13 n=1 Tax=Aspergillus campestris (strain IBT 28561) TaxID=1392248 RepID=A0A2I1CTF9_ASPC2|nr:TFIID-18kDa-domain-containing protein [Aspergillus campestris IBT 28561]PKY00895.1 TFIID-18kDa-domain-containing protein [Aspergillus campestris IBT 28561]